MNHWQPTASLEILRRRAICLHRIREYFVAQGVLEVETPLLARCGTTDPALSSFAVLDPDGSQRFLQTSPEFAMKRLLAAGSGDIYQIAHAFRREERSCLHLEEFSIVEWYRVGFDHHQLMDDVEGLLRAVGFRREIKRDTYATLCERFAGLNPHTASTSALAEYARQSGAQVSAADRDDRALLLDLLFGCGVLPRLRAAGALLIHDFPREHAAYAKLTNTKPPVAERFELIIGGVEIANGFHEVTAPDEQAARHARENQLRQMRGLPEMAIDSALLAALSAGLPPCAGVAIGLDRLLMVLESSTDIAKVVAFGGG
ncbi:MAG: EF-P lysine aminoacylase GenX [Gammaproteobacteria bacterium]|nr:EF-P lysine aminoacylase GenX [Gammaproteobacteria bacterium]